MTEQREQKRVFSAAILVKARVLRGPAQARRPGYVRSTHRLTCLTLAPPLAMLFGEVVEPLGGSTQLEAVDC